MSREWSHDDHEAHESTGRERWLVTYADLMTLLLVFFVIMYAMSAKISVDAFDKFSQSLSSSLKKTTPTPKPADDKGFLPTDSVETRKFKANATKVIQALVETNTKDAVVDVDQRGLVVSLLDSSFFDSGSANIKGSAVPILKKIAGNFKGMPNDIRVEGHTDNVPIHTAHFPTNWELSSARATSVVRFLSEQIGLPAHRMSAVGYAEHKPIASNGTNDGRKRNRRVDIILVRQETEAAAGAAGMPLNAAPAVVTPAPRPKPQNQGGFYDPFGNN